jgi:NAD(P)-dependent dehydrogenase (short-subunit alcohol dehydrogenase family)
MKHVGPAILEAGGGSIVNISSIFGAVGGFGGSIAYHASKGAVRLMTKSAALHWAKQGIRVNSVHPGFVDTPMIEQAKDNDQIMGAIFAMTPMGRLARPEESRFGGVVPRLGRRFLRHRRRVLRRWRMDCPVEID